VLEICSVPRLRRRITSQLLFAALLVGHAASGQTAPPPETPATAAACPEQDPTICGRRHFEAGTAAFEKEDFATAATEFQAALEQRAHPVIRFNLGVSLARLGRPSAAIEQLKHVQADTEADPDLRQRAEREQKSAERALARVTVKLSDPKHERVELDGSEVKLEGRNELPLDPGGHHVRVISGSSVVLDQELELAPGERVELRVGERSRSIDVVVVPEAEPKKEPAKVPPPAPPPPPPRSRKLSPVWAPRRHAVTLALGGATLWSGLDTNSAYSDYKKKLPELGQTEGDARAAAQAEADRLVSEGHARERRTNLLLAGTIVGAAGTAVLGVWFTDFGRSKTASLWLSPSSVAISGAF